MIASPYPHPPVTPPAGHPRLMLRASDLPRVRQNIERFPTAAKLWQTLCGTPLVKTGAMPEYGTYHLRDYLILEARALALLLDPDAVSTACSRSATRSPPNPPTIRNPSCSIATARP